MTDENRAKWIEEQAENMANDLADEAIEQAEVAKGWRVEHVHDDEIVVKRKTFDDLEQAASNALVYLQNAQTEDFAHGSDQAVRVELAEALGVEIQ